MMNEKFDAQLRQHLLGSANERPAQGQLAAVIDAVATTRQRPPLVARLTWSPRRIGGFPATAIRFGLIAAALALAMVAGALLAGNSNPQRTPSTPFEGSWITIDPTDQSGMTLVVGEGLAPDLYFEDGYASGPVCADHDVKRFTGRGSGRIVGNVLSMTFPNGGGCGSRTVEIDGEVEYEPTSDTLIGPDGLEWSRPLAERRPATPRPPTIAPSRFTSSMHGVSMDYPSGWQVRPATQAWAGEVLTFDSEAADVIYDPALEGRVHLLVASQPYGGLSSHDWKWLTHAGVCGDRGGGAGSSALDGVSATVFGCGTTEGILATGPDRGYLVTVEAPADDPALAGTYDGDWLEPFLETVNLRPDAAVPGPEPTAACIEYRAAGTYALEPGFGPVSVTVPATADQPWNGHPLTFTLQRAPCLSDGPTLEAMSVYGVPADACNPGEDSALGESYDATMEALLAQTGHAPISPTSTTVGGLAASVFTVTAPTLQEATCADDRTMVFEGLELQPGEAATLYLVDVEGWALAFVIRGADDADSMSDFEAVIASVDIAVRPDLPPG